MIVYRLIYDNGYIDFAEPPSREIVNQYNGVVEEVEVSIFNLEDYKKQINEAHTNWFLSVAQSEKYDYLSIEEIGLWVNDEEFSEEANILLNFYRVTYKDMKAYLETVTEETAQPIETFINSLPKLDN